MRQSVQCITPSEALRRVFFPSLKEASIRTHTTRPTLNRTGKPSQCLSFLGPSPFYLQHVRPASTSSPTVTFRRFVPSSSDPAQFSQKDTNPAQSRPKDNNPARPPRDEEISAYKVYLVSPSDSRLTEPQVLSEVLSSRERDEKGKFAQFVQQVSPPSGDRPFPVCKMFDKKAVRAAEEGKRKEKKTNRQLKHLELSWTVGDNDLGHQMVRLKNFLEKGMKVEVVFGSRRKSGWTKRRQASEMEARGVLEKIRKAVEEVEGAKEKEMQGTVGQQAVLSFEGKVNS